MGVYVPMVPSFRKSKNMVTKNREFPFTKHYSLPSYNPKGHLKVKDIIEKQTLEWQLWTYPKVYVQSFRSLALLLHTERENLLKTPSVCRRWIGRFISVFSKFSS